MIIKSKPKVSVVWLKRDLRLNDHLAFQCALESGYKILPIYIYEPLLINDPHYSDRHFQFIRESIEDLNNQLHAYNTSVLEFHCSVEDALKSILENFEIELLTSHMEVGILKTFKRDLRIKQFCGELGISWKEFEQNGVQRGLTRRDHWKKNWLNYVNAPQIKLSFNERCFLSKDLQSQITTNSFDKMFMNVSNIQKGGTTPGLNYLLSFIDSRYKNYNKHISKPALSRESCSRLSPYLAWGCLSVRQVYQTINSAQSIPRYIKNSFLSRLRWQAHFIQKFESQPSIEFHSVNKGYHQLKKPIDLSLQRKWKEGLTGFPLVDASMRCLKETGYINFRMRAMVVSFFTHILWQPWQDASTYLASLFLDFEPGIHYSQLQMQAGETGVNQIRIYNPLSNAETHDPEAVFIKKWVPELTHLPSALIHQLNQLTLLEEQFYNFNYGTTYPKPIVDLKRARERASSILWEYKKKFSVKEDNKRILQTHINHD